MKTLLTGGLGFIGSHLMKRLDNAIIFDRKNNSTLHIFNYNYHTIIHLAASTYLTEGYDYKMIEDNILLSDNIVRSHRSSRIIYASSAAIYNPNNLYSYSKRFCEDIFRPYNSTGLRYYNVYGFGDNGIVGKLIKAALTGEEIIIYGGEQTRDFIYVDDVVSETIKAISSTEKIIEVGTGIETSINQLIDAIEFITGKNINIIKKERIQIEATNSCCPNPITDFVKLDEGLRKTIREYENIYGSR